MKAVHLSKLVFVMCGSALGVGCGEPAQQAVPSGNGGSSGSMGGSSLGGSAMGGTTAGGVGGTLGGSAMGGTTAGGVGGTLGGQGGTSLGGNAGSSGSTAGTAGGGMGGSLGGTAGSGATGGSSGAPTDPDPSAGCGTTEVNPCDQEGSPCMLNGLDYYVDIPDDYDANRPYPVVFQYHPLGGSAEGARNMYRVRPLFPDAIYVSPQGSDNGFPNRDGVDEDMTRAIIDDIEAKYCVDRARYFATGFSYGGSMSYTAACNMSDKFRAVAAMAGAPISGARCTSQEPERPVAILGIHGEEDTALEITLAEPIVESWLEKNGCGGEPQPSELLGADCATVESALATGAYQGCQEGYPVIWCPIPGYPHNIPSWSPEAIAGFFQMF